MRNFCILFAMLLFSFCAKAQDVNWSEDIAPIIFNKCTECHRQGEIGPMPFTNYGEVAGYGSLIEFVTSSGYMPPWSPEPGYGELAGERILSSEEKQLISDWVDAGMPQGDLALQPPMPEFPEGSQVGVPDLILTMDEAYTHEGDLTDQYQVFVLETGLTEDRDIKAIEVRPGNNAIAHHAILGVDNSGQAAALAAEDEDYGYESFGGFGFNPVDPFLGAWVPGAAPVIYPNTIGKQLLAGSDLLVQMHYGPTSIDESDQTTVNIFFADEPVDRYVQTFPINPFDLDEPFVLPPNEVSTFHGQIEVPTDISLLGIAPHCHLLGKSWEVYATSPDLNDTIPLISIPDWDFNWQGFYTYEQIQHIPAGYTVHAIATYDNTASNPFNPSDPPQWSSWGEGTEDEMYLVYLSLIPYQPGDEDTVLSLNENLQGIQPIENRIYSAYPNPADDQVTVAFSLAQPGTVSLEVLDVKGQLTPVGTDTFMLPMGHHRRTFNVSQLAPGRYTIVLSHEGGRSVKSLVVR